MKPHISNSFYLITAFFLISNAQRTTYSIGDSINEFSINLLATTIREVKDDTINVALSPYTVWTLLTIISEGAGGKTAQELADVLKLPPNTVDRDAFRNSYRNLSSILTRKTYGVNLDIANAVFTNLNQKLKPSFASNTRKNYDVDVRPTNFKNPQEAKDEINAYISKVTNDRITYFVNEDDIREAEIFLASTFYMKGEWQVPFNKTATNRAPFYDEKGNKIGDVDMMYQVGVLPYYRSPEWKLYALELPYGEGDKLSMIVILPFKNENILNVLNTLSKIKITTLMDALTNSAQEFEGDETIVYMPKFKINSSFNLNIVLDKLGIRDVFNFEKADLLGIFDHYLYVSRLLQNAEIEVNEEGTVVSAAAGASVIYKSTPPKFQANKPFIYLIVDKVARTILFTGQFSNPKQT